MVRLIDTLISLYSLGLIFYSILNWMKIHQTEKAMLWMGQFYEPVLSRLRSSIKPVQVGGTVLDITPAIFLIGLILLKGLIIYLLPRGL